jgi:phosphocarrier protein
MKITMSYAKAERGLHWAVAAKIVSVCNASPCRVTISNNKEETGNGRSILSLIALGIGHGGEVWVRVEGEDEDIVSEEIEKILEGE